ncbi:MAG: hypothetical protein ACRD01_10325 [Terriglobales bacterium]
MLLSETELRAALEPLLDRLLSERLRLFGLQQEPRLQAIVQAALLPAAQAAGPEALRGLLAAPSPGACFTELFQLSGELLGEARELWVEYHSTRALWQRAGGPLSAAEAIEVMVRGRVIGRLQWPAGALPPGLRPRLELLTAVAGLVLLRQGLEARTVSTDGVAAAVGTEAVRALPPPARAAADRTEAASAEERFARLLVEDLRLYLQHERAAELAGAHDAGEFHRRFAAEWERLRRAFLERYPQADVSILGEELAFHGWQ